MFYTVTPQKLCTNLFDQLKLIFTPSEIFIRGKHLFIYLILFYFKYI